MLASRFERIRLWAHETELVDRMASTRINDVFLPDFRLPDNVDPVSDLKLALENAEIVVGVMPSRFARGVYSSMRPYVDAAMRFVTATKGLENRTLLRMSEVAGEVIGKKFAVLSGPTFARECGAGRTYRRGNFVDDQALAVSIQREFSGPCFRLYTNDDPAGVEIGAALKNVIAIGAGICQGLGLGNNSIAALITRGLPRSRGWR